MMKKNILVFPCGSEIGLEIYEALKYSRFFHMIGGSSVEDHGRFVYDDYIGDIPFINNEESIAVLKRIIKERDIDAIYPTMDLVITTLKSHEAELGCKVISSDMETTEICLSKRKTYQKLEGIVAIQKVFDRDDIVEEDYPLFVKPEYGYGSKGTRLIHNKDELNQIEQGSMILEYLPGEEYTVDCFTDRKGNLLYFGARQRGRIRNGISVDTYFADNQEEFRPLIEAINANIRFRGAWFAQFKRNAVGKLCLMEIAARLGGSSSLSRAKGINFPLLSLFDAFEYDVKVRANNYKVELDRALNSVVRFDIDFRTIYVDYDDCLILDKSGVNADLVSFLYSMINKNKEIVLLSKHKGNLIQELHDFRLYELFDKIIHIDESEEKSSYIEDKKSIFIDDSFSERERIARAVDIPVLSPDMIGLIMV